MPHGVASVLWRDWTVRQLHRLGHRVEGRLVVEPDPTRESIPAERFLKADHLHKAIVHAPGTGLDSPAPPDGNAPADGGEGVVGGEESGQPDRKAETEQTAAQWRSAKQI